MKGYEKYSRGYYGNRKNRWKNKFIRIIYEYYQLKYDKINLILSIK